MQGSGGIAGVGILLMCMGALNASIAIFLLGDSGKKNKARGCTAAVFDMLRQHWASIAAVLVAINPLPACTMQCLF